MHGSLGSVVQKPPSRKLEVRNEVVAYPTSCESKSTATAASARRVIPSAA